MLKGLSIKDSLLPQPPSFGKKKFYEVHNELGVGSFGKVVVSHALSLRSCEVLIESRKRLGGSRLGSLPSRYMALLGPLLSCLRRQLDSSRRR